MEMDGQVWYADGLAFECRRCGECCRGVPGNVWVNPAEILTLAKHYRLSEETFRERFTKLHLWRGIRLIEQVNHDCIFFDAFRGCVVYRLRPRQCHSWPFWRRVLRTPESWAAAAKSCPGMGRGRLYDLEEIEAISAEDGLPPG